MNNWERIRDTENRHGPLAAALLACEFANCCGSRNGAWNYAEFAVELAAKAGVRLEPGRSGWPDTQIMERQLREAGASYE